jgi:hypothetical protein
MDFRFSNLKRLPLLAVALAAVSFAQAQSFMRPGQAIIFSAPDGNGDASSNAPSLAAQPPVAPTFEDAVQAPDFSFKNPPPTGEQMPAPPPTVISPAEADERANWALMTPAEILGVATPEQELQIPERDAAGQRKNLTVVERFYERQEQQQTNGIGGFLSGTPPLRGDFQDDEEARLNANGFNPAVTGFGNPQAADSFQTPAPGGGQTASQNGDGGWSKIFISPETTPAQSPAQVADAAAFQQLLEPSQPSKSSRPSSDDGLFSSPQPAPSSAFGQSANPAGTPFNQFNNGIGGLPGIAGQVSVPTVTAVPDWKPQPAPWLLQGPQPDAIPKRVTF